MNMIILVVVNQNNLGGSLHESKGRTRNPAACVDYCAWVMGLYSDKFQCGEESAGSRLCRLKPNYTQTPVLELTAFHWSRNSESLNSS